MWAKASEFAVSPSGINEYYGTPRNPYSKFWRRLIPGGSSSGAAEAIVLGLADVAFGTDTAGSVRVPAAFVAEDTARLSPLRAFATVSGGDSRGGGRPARAAALRARA